MIELKTYINSSTPSGVLIESGTTNFGLIFGLLAAGLCFLGSVGAILLFVFCQKTKDQNDLDSSNDINNNASEILSPMPLNGVYEYGSIASMEDALSVPGTSVSDTYVSLPDAALSEGPTYNNIPVENSPITNGYESANNYANHDDMFLPRQ